MAPTVKRGKVEREGDHISIDGLTIKEAVEALVRIEEQDNLVVAIHYEFSEMFFTEALVAFMAALKERHGEFFAANTPGMFGPTPPTLLGIETAPGVTTHCIWGAFELPGMKGQFTTELGNREGTPVLTLSGKIRQKDKAELEAIVELTKQVGRRDSIYKGQALELRFPDPEDCHNPLDMAPKFMDLGLVEPPVFSDDIQAVIDNYIYEDIEATEATKLNRMPIKKGILLEGPPGVGKTLLAHTLAQKCVQNGWTFAYVKDVKELAKAVNLIRNRWEPAMVFAEDLDRVVGKDRTEAVNEVLNVIDGVNGKLSDIVVLVTTNDIDVIHKAMLRPGRLDVLISVIPPDGPTVERLIRREAGLTLNPVADLTEVGLELAGTMPAVVVQVVQRAKRAAQRRTRLANPGKPSVYWHNPVIDSADLLVAARSMKQHIERLKPTPVDDRTPLEKAADTLAQSMRDATTMQLAALMPSQWDAAPANGGLPPRHIKKSLPRTTDTPAFGGKDTE